MYIKIQKSLYTIPTAHKCCGDPSLFVTLRAGHTAPSSADAGLPARRRSAVLPTAQRRCGDPFLLLRSGRGTQSLPPRTPDSRRGAEAPYCPQRTSAAGTPPFLLRSGRGTQPLPPRTPDSRRGAEAPYCPQRTSAAGTPSFCYAPVLRSGRKKSRRAPLCGFHTFDRQTVFASSSALTIATPADAPMRVAPASIMARAVA